MAYTPINWQTGDTITAEKLNKMDNGWAVESSSQQLFSETVTTSGDGSYEAELSYSQLIVADTITVTYDGTEYVCASIEAGVYGAPYSDGGFDFSEFPFNLETTSGAAAYLITQTAGEHTIAATVAVTNVQISTDFDAAVAAVSLFVATAQATTWQEVYDAVAAKKLAFVYEKSGSGLFCFPVLSVTSDNGYEITTVRAAGGIVESRYYQSNAADAPIYPN